MPTASSSDIYVNIFYAIFDCLINELEILFSHSSSVIFRGISALCHGRHTFLFIKDLKDYASLTHSMQVIYNMKLI